MIEHAKVNPTAVRAGKVNKTLNKKALEDMLRKGIRIDANATAPAGGRMLGVGRATGNQAKMFMQPMSLVSEYVGGRRKPLARYFFSRDIDANTPKTKQKEKRSHKR